MSGAVSKFISIEGVEGAGKSTAVKVICDYLDNKSIDYHLTREPGGTEVAEAIRSILLTPFDEKVCAETELLLMFATRKQNIEHVIKPTLAAGKWLVSDRFTDASFAYQGGGRQIDLAHVNYLAQWIQGDVKPDITILLDLPVEVGLKRIEARGEKDRIEQEGVEFFHRVRDTYLQRAANEPQRYRVVDASQTEAEVAADLQRVLDDIQ
ncbi:MAG: dTMP kinase [Coxiellaceae bacterium]|nr:dTMP kinase [Coxiellaceae bacterium]